MARERKSSTPKPPQSTGSTPAANPVQAPHVAGTKGLAQAKTAPVTAPVIQEIDTRPETSPYRSPACTIPFASPLTLPLSILKKSPKLHAAYAGRLPELPAIPEDVGHVLVHYLHTGTYESLRPKPTDSMSKQICELETSIQAYTAARAYDLPDLMRLAEAKINEHGEGLPLPALLKVARDAYPTLTDGDDWFLDYLRSRIRPHLRDPKSLLGSDLLDQISSVLSPNKILLRTVLELLCETNVVRPEPATSAAASTIASPITSAGSSRPVSPLPTASPMSLLETGSRAIAQDEFLPARKNLKPTPWPSPDNMSEASWAGETSPGPVLPAAMPPKLEVEPMPELLPAPTAPSRPEIEYRAVIKAEVTAISKPVVKISVEPEAELEAEPGVGHVVELEVMTTLESKAKAVAESESEIKMEEETISEPIPAAQRERDDSGKGIDLEVLPEELEPVPEPMPRLETESNPLAQVQRRVLREADSGFWEGPDSDAGKEPALSLADFEHVPTAEPAHKLESIAGQKGVLSTDARDFADPGVDLKSDLASERTIAELEPNEASVLAAPLAQEPGPEAPEANYAEAELLPTKSTDEATGKLAEAVECIPPDIAPTGELPEREESGGAEALPEKEKAQEETNKPETVAKPEPEANSSHPVPVADDAQRPGSSEPNTTQPSIERGTKPTERDEIRPVNADTAAHAVSGASVEKPPVVLGAKPALEQEGLKVDADSAGVQPCNAQVRQRSWKKRFLSLKYPVLFGRGM